MYIRRFLSRQRKWRYAYFLSIFGLMFLLGVFGIAVRVPDASVLFPLKTGAILVAVIFFVFPVANNIRNKNLCEIPKSLVFWIERFVISLVVYMWFLYMVLSINGFFDLGSSVTYQGVIVGKESISARFRTPGYHFVTLQTQGGKQVQLEVSSDYYSRINKGDECRATYGRGWLGIPNVWTWNLDTGWSCKLPTIRPTQSSRVMQELFEELNGSVQPRN